jgi:hypothetical protein
MIVPVYIHYRDLEELCYYDDWEKGVVCDDYDYDHEYTVDEVEFDRADLEDIVDEYFDEIIDILLRNHRKELEKALNQVSKST